ncbi:MAG: Flp family type IVb pilin [Caedimonadaceae bacterium]|nr:MAG: Flp family type IVb pilin [Caedimonadaceae bacterium]
MDNLVSFFRNEDGATAIEYGLIAALISVAILAVLSTIGTDLFNVFTKIATKLTAAAA